jgi:hypothetical protein
VAVTLEVQHHVNQVLQGAGAGDGAVRGHVPDQVRLRGQVQVLGHGADPVRAQPDRWANAQKRSRRVHARESH